MNKWKNKLIGFAIALSLGITGCSIENVGMNVNDGSGITISKENNDKVDIIRDRVQGNSTGIYKINNLGKGKYKAELSMEEYNDGELKEVQGILSYNIEIRDNTDNLYIGMNINADTNNNGYDLTFDISGSSGSITSGKLNLSEEKSGYGYSILESNEDEVRRIELGKELSIAAFNVGKDGSTYGQSVGNYKNENDNKPIEQENAKDIIVYLKISKAS